VNAFLLLGTILVWRLNAGDQQAKAGTLAAIMAILKLTPAALCWWLLVAGRWRASGWAIATGVLALAVSLLGAGVDAHLEYLRILGDRSQLGVYPLSLAGVGEFFGASREVAVLLPAAGAIVGLGAVFVLRRWPAYSYVAAVATMVLGSPAVSINWLVLLYAVLAPFAWPIAATPRGGGAQARPELESAGSIRPPSKA
jgi:hypothetical protein